MTTDAWLAIAHHIAIFGVFAVLVAEWTIVRPGIDAADVRRLGRVDAAYGALAGLVLAAGVSRVVWGAKPADFYLENPAFWLEMTAFATVGLLSIRPTIRYLGWRKALDSDEGALPASDHTEFSYVLDGEYRTQGHAMQAGDAYVAAPGSVHTDFTTEAGATYLSVFKL